MFLALLAVSFVASYVLLNLNLDSERMAVERARQSAWMLREISEAARLYVRDRSVDVATPQFARASLCTTPRAITATDLINGGYISTNIGQRNAANNYVTPMQQEVRIVAANSVINTAACAPTDLQNVAASAYILLEPNGTVRTNELINLSESLRDFSLPALPAIYNNGANITQACGGGPAAMLWDTGCLTQAQYTFLHPAAFAEGAFGMPAWLSFRGDNRAIFRFPQPENPQAQQMSTDMRMATAPNIDTASCAQVNIRTTDSANVSIDKTATVLVPSGVCVTNNDTAASNVRHNISNIRNIEFDRAIINAQTTDNNGAGAIAEPQPALAVTGASSITGAVRSFRTGTNSLAAQSIVLGGTAPALSVATPLASGVAPAVAVTGNAVMGDLQATTGNTTGITSVAGPTSVGGNMTINGNLTLNNGGGGTRGFVANRIAGTLNGLNVTNTATISGLTSTGGIIIDGAANTLSLGAASIEADVLNLPATSRLAVGGDLTLDGGGTISTISAVGTCYGDCPDKDGDDPDPPL